MRWSISMHLVGAIALLYVLFTPNGSIAVDLCFDSPTNYPAGSSPRPIVATDLDGDSDLDLAIGNWSDGNVSIRLNDGSGVFSAAGNYPVGVNPISLDAANLDGDGDQDLVVVNWGSNNISILYNNGDATFDPGATIGAGTNSSCVTTADLNGDDSLDLAVTNYGDNNLQVMFYIGGGAYAAPAPHTVGSGPWSVKAADLDGDGDSELITANGTTSNISVLKNNGDGTFQSAMHYGAGLVPTSIAIADLDGDLDPDLAAANYDSHNVSVLKNNGDGTFAAKVDYSVGIIPRAVIASDLDADGDMDLVSANYGSNNASVLRNNGDGTYLSALNFGVGSYPISVIASNLDGDSFDDLSIVNTGSNNVSILLNCLHFPTTRRVPKDYPTIQAGIDAALDGDTVLVAAGSYTEHIDFGGKKIALISESGSENTIITKLVDGIPIIQFTNGETNSTSLQGFTLTGGGVSDGWAIRCQPGSPTIRGNVVLDTPEGPGPALWCESPNGLVLDSNVFRCSQRADGGVVVYYASAPRITRNLFTGWSTPIIISNSNSVDFDHNTVVGNQYGVLWYYSSGTLRNSICAHGTWYGVRKEGTGSLILSHNDVHANVPSDYFGIIPDPNSISSAPLFCDTSSGDFSLGSSSPCVGAGEGGSDIGAFNVGCAIPAPEQPAVQRIGIGLPSDSLHITDAMPVISWKYFDQQSRPHTGSEIEVGANNEWSVAEMWQLPTITGPDTSILYAGLPLVDGATYYVRVRVLNDTLWSNWLVAPFRMNSAPTAPSLIYPAEGAVVLTGRPPLQVMNASDAEGDARRYDFEVYRDGDLTQMAAYIAGKVEGFGLTTWLTDSLTSENQRHWWRARANDGYENGPWSQTYSFIVDAYNQPPSVVQLIALADGGATSDITPDFVWARPVDPDPNASITYKLVLGLDPGFTFKSEVMGITDTVLSWSSSLDVNESYWWKVEADDGRGGNSMSIVWSFTTVVPCACDCHADPVCDSVKSDVIDVINTINVAFRGSSPSADPNVACPRLPTDFNCSNSTDVIDVVKVINVAFRGANVATEYCVPCN